MFSSVVAQSTARENPLLLIRGYLRTQGVPISDSRQLMNARSLKIAGIAAGALAIVGTPPSAFAQTIDVFSGGLIDKLVVPIATKYQFTSPMILNSIGFVTQNADGSGTFQYAISSLNGGAYQTVLTSNASLATAVDSVRWFTLSSPITLNANDIVSVKTEGTSGANSAAFKYNQLQNVSANVSYSTYFYNIRGENSFNTLYGSSYPVATNSNIRVSNPGSNVAPEPGSIALLLTGGGALAGIALRRRRNAA